MTEAVHRAVIAAPADDVWAVVAAFGEGAWTGLPFEADGSGEGAVRTVTMPFGPVVERCERHDAAHRILGYTVLSGNPFPVTDYHATMRVTPVDERSSELEWSATFETDDADAAVGIATFLRRAAEALARHVEATPDR